MDISLHKHYAIRCPAQKQTCMPRKCAFLCICGGLCGVLDGHYDYYTLFQHQLPAERWPSCHEQSGSPKEEGMPAMTERCQAGAPGVAGQEAGEVCWTFPLAWGEGLGCCRGGCMHDCTSLLPSISLPKFRLQSRKFARKLGSCC